MTDLPPRARQLLEQARAGQARASAASRARVRAAVAASVAASAAASTHAQPQPTAAHGLSWHAGYAKWLAVAALGTLAGTAVQLSRPPAPPPRAASASAQSTGAVAAESSSSRQTDAQETPASTQPAAQSARHAARVPDLQGELQLLRRAHDALDAGELRTALDALAQHRRHFEHGQLRQEREAMTLIARCTLGEEPVRELGRYLRTAPQSVLRTRVEQRCKTGARP